MWLVSFLVMGFTELVTRFTVLGAQILSCEAGLKYNPKAVDYPYSVHANIAAMGTPWLPGHDCSMHCSLLGNSIHTFLSSVACMAPSGTMKETGC